MTKLDDTRKLLEAATDNRNTAAAFILSNNPDCVAFFVAAIADSMLAMAMLRQLEAESDAATGRRPVAPAAEAPAAPAGAGPVVDWDRDHSGMPGDKPREEQP